MTKEESKNTIEKIKKAIKEAIAEVYENARKTGSELVIADENGKVKKIKPA